jgi:adenosylcobinamide-phosphate synthase
MGLSLQIILAVLLDQLLGDPRWLPHPVRVMAAVAGRLEEKTRALLPPFAAGVCTVFLTLALTGLASSGLLRAGTMLHPWLGEAVAVFLIYTSIAARDLVRHSTAVHAALADGDLAKARQRVGLIVGRDTAELDEEGVTRAAVESVAESMVDGVTAPLFFAVLAGPVGAMLYRAVNTMDSLFGYKNERYRRFGTAAARLDDLANFLPARLSGLLLPVAAFFLGLDPRRSLAVLRRDRKNHASPNSGHSEAAMAGALGVRLGGPAVYSGTPAAKPFLGEATRPLAAKDILRSNRLMLLASAFTLLVLLALRGQILLLFA